MAGPCRTLGPHVGHPFAGAGEVVVNPFCFKMSVDPGTTRRDSLAATMMNEHTPITAKLVAALYTEAMLLADEARSYFDSEGQLERAALDPVLRVAYSCESLRVTTRLMHVVSWLLVRKAVSAGEMTEAEGEAPERRLGRAGDTELDSTRLGQLPPRAREIIEASRDLYERVKRLDDQFATEVPLSPARALLGRLERSF